MELHQALKDIISQRGKGLLENPQIINYLLDYRCFVDKPATKLILRDIINSGYASEILSLDTNAPAWQTKYKHYVHEFIDSCGYKEELATYVFESIAFALDLKVYSEEPEIRRKINVDSFFDLDDETSTPPPLPNNPTPPKPQFDPRDAYTIALSFFKEGKYQQAKGFAEKAINNVIRGDVPSDYLKLMGDILMKSDDYEGAIGYYNECLTNKAKEQKMTADTLREALKKHEVKGFDNFIFCYFYCLFFDNRIPEDKWLSMLKKEARNGSFEAIQFCAQYGIDPVENHVDIFFTDMSKLSSGDILYEDGTFSHELSPSKLAICVIALTETSEYEKTMGWSHGYILPLVAANRNAVYEIVNNRLSGVGSTYKWSSYLEDLPFPHSHFTIDDLSHWSQANMINTDHLITISDYDIFPAFKAARDFHIKIPISNTSEWFLPSANTILNILSRLPLISRAHLSWLNSSTSTFWTSSQFDSQNALLIEGLIRRPITCFKAKARTVVPIAAF